MPINNDYNALYAKNYYNGNYLAYLTMNLINNITIVEFIIVDRAYSIKRNIKCCNNVNLDLVAVFNSNITNKTKLVSDGFAYNRDSVELFYPKGEHRAKTC